jgi:Phospholipase_D-nuclease N-terminal
VVGGAIELGLIELGFRVAALRDIYLRADEEIRGKKWVWVGAQAINTLGPLSYFMFGRRKK